MISLTILARRYFAAPSLPSASALLSQLKNSYFRNLPKQPVFKKKAPGYMVLGNCPVFMPQSVRLSPEQKCMLGSLLQAEGNWCSINTYDNQGFTWGMGFSNNGDLPKVLKVWFQHCPDAERSLKRLGFVFVSTQHGPTLSRATINDLRGQRIEWRSLYNMLDPQSFTEELDKKRAVRRRDTFINAQLKQLLRSGWGALAIPDYAENWPLDMLIAGAHLTHWMRLLSWHRNIKDYSKCHNVAELLDAAYSLLGQKGLCGVALDETSGCVIVPFIPGLNRIRSWALGTFMTGHLRPAPRMPKDKVLFTTAVDNVYRCYNSSTT